jgi:hypothetical protein
MFSNTSNIISIPEGLEILSLLREPEHDTSYITGLPFVFQTEVDSDILEANTPDAQDDSWYSSQHHFGQLGCDFSCCTASPMYVCAKPTDPTSFPSKAIVIPRESNEEPAKRLKYCIDSERSFLISSPDEYQPTGSPPALTPPDHPNFLPIWAKAP